MSRKLIVRRSRIHGKGVFAGRDLHCGESLIEYLGEIISWEAAARRHPHDPEQPNHTFYFHLTDTTVIDGGVSGNDGRFFNHSCAPNCQALEADGRVFIEALRDVKKGEELNFDFSLVLEGRHTQAVKNDYACRCLAATCRGTMLAPKRRSRAKGQDA